MGTKTLTKLLMASLTLMLSVSVAVAGTFALFVKFSFEVRLVRLHSPLPKIIKNIGVLVASKSDGGFLG